MGQAAMFIQVATALTGAALAKRAYEDEAKQMENQAKLATLEAGQRENARRGQLLQIMSALNASESSRGLKIGSGGTSSALRQNEKNFADADIQSIRLMGMTKKRNFGLGARQSRTAGKAAFLGGVAEAGSTYGTFRESTKKRKVNT